MRHELVGRDMQKYVSGDSATPADGKDRREAELQALLLECIKELKVARGNPAIADHLHPSSALINRVKSALHCA